jgi:hypothetical protein
MPLKLGKVVADAKVATEIKRDRQSIMVNEQHYAARLSCTRWRSSDAGAPFEILSARWRQVRLAVEGYDVMPSRPSS